MWILNQSLRQNRIIQLRIIGKSQRSKWQKRKIKRKRCSNTKKETKQANKHLPFIILMLFLLFFLYSICFRILILTVFVRHTHYYRANAHKTMYTVEKIVIILRIVPIINLLIIFNFHPLDWKLDERKMNSTNPRFKEMWRKRWKWWWWWWWWWKRGRKTNIQTHIISAYCTVNNANDVR